MVLLDRARQTSSENLFLAINNKLLWTIFRPEPYTNKSMHRSLHLQNTAIYKKGAVNLNTKVCDISSRWEALQKCYYTHIFLILGKWDILHAATVLGQRSQLKRMADRSKKKKKASDKTTESQGMGDVFFLPPSLPYPHFSILNGFSMLKKKN